MRAIIISRPGGPEVLELSDAPAPTPGDDEVLVKVHATAVNRADLLQRQGRYPAPAGSPAHIPGLEFAGEIAAVGNKVSDRKIGERVYGIAGGGTYAEFVTVAAGTAMRIPDTLDWVQAAAIPEAFITAHDAMITQAQLVAGESVLVHAVGSAVGLAAVQMACARLATPFGTARTEDKIERAMELGLRDGMVAGNDISFIHTKASAWTEGRGMNVVLDLVGGAYLAESIESAALHGRIMIIGTMAGATSTIPSGLVLRKRLTIRGTALRSRTVAEKVAASQAFEADIAPLIAKGTVKPVVDTVYRLEEAAKAHEHMAANSTFGKLVLTISE